MTVNSVKKKFYSLPFFRRSGGARTSAFRNKKFHSIDSLHSLSNLAIAVSLAVGIVILTLGALKIFGPVGSLSYCISIIEGGLITGAAFINLLHVVMTTIQNRKRQRERFQKIELHESPQSIEIKNLISFWSSLKEERRAQLIANYCEQNSLSPSVKASLLRCNCTDEQSTALAWMTKEHIQSHINQNKQKDEICNLINANQSNNFVIHCVFDYLVELKAGDILAYLFADEKIGELLLINFQKNDALDVEAFTAFCFEFGIFPLHLLDDMEIKFIINSLPSATSQILGIQESRNLFFRTVVFENTELLIEAFQVFIEQEKDLTVLCTTISEILQEMTSNILDPFNSQDFKVKLVEQQNLFQQLLLVVTPKLFQKELIKKFKEQLKLTIESNQGQADNTLLLEYYFYGQNTLWEQGDEEQVSSRFESYILSLPNEARKYLDSFVPEEYLKGAIRICEQKNLAFYLESSMSPDPE